MRGVEADACEHVFVTSQGGPYARFRRALAARNGAVAWAAASEVPAISLDDALLLCLLVSDSPARYGKAATRWFTRFCVECLGVSLAEGPTAHRSDPSAGGFPPR
jgi:hypothetical protein